MPNWNEVLKEVHQLEQADPNVGALDTVRRKYLAQLQQKTGRNVIAYYSGWLQKPGVLGTAINDDDKNSLMATIHNLDRDIGLDLILHTPGGDISATESIVHYLRQMFGTDIRAIIPQIAMSAGTMIACACKEIIMGKQSNIGPFDPQFNGIPAYGVIEEFEKALKAITADPSTIPLWQMIVQRYHPTFLGECEKAIQMSEEIVHKWLTSGMFKGQRHAKKKADKAVKALNNHSDTKTHARHIHMDEVKQLGLKVISLEADDELQDLVLTVHHAYMLTLASSSALKIVENQLGAAVVHQVQQPAFPFPLPPGV